MKTIEKQIDCIRIARRELGHIEARAIDENNKKELITVIEGLLDTQELLNNIKNLQILLSDTRGEE